MADPLVAGEYGKAAFDAVGPLLLSGWAEVGPDLLRALTTASRLDEGRSDGEKWMETPFAGESTTVGQKAPESPREDAKPDGAPADGQSNVAASNMVDGDLLERAREADARHCYKHRQPISADTLRKNLRIGAARPRLLVAIIRTDPQGRSPQDQVTAQAGGDDG